MEEIQYYISKETKADSNLALEEYILRSRREGRIFLLWQNDRSVILGKNQIASAEADLSFAREHNIQVFQRITGGGAVFHDMGNINFSFFADYDPKEPPRLSDLLSPVTDALLQMGLPAVTGSRNDLLINGRKICGTASAVDRGRLLLHGCLLFSVDLALLERVLTPPAEKLARHGIPSVRSRVANISPLLPGETRESFKQRLTEAVLSGKMARELCFRPEELKDILILQKEYRDLAL